MKLSNTEMELENSLLCKILIGMSITISFIILVVFAIVIIDEKIINIEIVSVAVSAAATGVVIGLLLPSFFRKLKRKNNYDTLPQD